MCIVHPKSSLQVGSNMYEQTPYEPPLFWPRFIESKNIERTLACYDRGRCTDEYGRHTQVSPADLLVQAVDHNLLTFVRSLVPHLVSIFDANGHAYCNKHGAVTSAKIRAGRTTRWLVASLQWGYVVPSLVMLSDLRRLFDHIGCGTVTTPGALGSASMRRVWRDTYGPTWKDHRHQRPPSYCCDDLYAGSTGGRSELLAEGKEFPRLIEIDQKNAYLNAFRRLPTGVAVSFRKHVESFKAWVGTVIVTIKEKLLYGPFPWRRSKDEQWSYPTEPGCYECWLWNVEEEQCRKEGCSTSIQGGWGWYDLTDEPNAWVEWASNKRDTAPDKTTEDLWKVCQLAGMSLHGARPEHYELTKDRVSPDDLIALDDGKGLDSWVHKVYEQYPSGLPHWFQYMLAVARISQFQEWKTWVAQEYLVATNTDGCYVREEALPLVMAKYKHKREKRETGERGWQEITPAPGRDAVIVPFNRGLISRQKTTLPGVQRE